MILIDIIDKDRVLKAFAKRFPRTKLNADESRLEILEYTTVELQEDIEKYISAIVNSVEESEIVINRDKFTI